MNIPLWMLLFLVAFLGWVLRQIVKDSRFANESAPFRWYVIGALIFAISVQLYLIIKTILGA